ncbi:MAG: hexokinase [Lentisphaeria bacterium]|nr:hexokinase [Lentisphaeria bacterium]
MSTADRAQGFLAGHGLVPEAVDVSSVQAAFLEEMENGLAGRDGSLAMIPTYITIDKPVPAGTPVTVLDAGGTNLRVATVTFAPSGTPTISGFRKTSMPGIDSHVSGDEFFSNLAEVVRPVCESSARVGFCFSYPTQITPDCDGRLLYWTKEIRAPEVEGVLIGSGLNEKLAAMGVKRKRIVILNDTIATLLAGKSFGSARRYSNYTGVIVGTGSNTAYVEENRNIRKLEGAGDGAMAINIESGNFARCPRSDFDRMFDATTSNPGKQMFEKMISGGYLGGVGLHVLRTAAQEGLLSAPAGTVINGWKDLSTKDMDDFLWNPYREGRFQTADFSEKDREVMMILCAAVIRRAAVLVAINISTPILKTGSGVSPLHPVCITVDGSTFYKTNTLKSRVEEHLRHIFEPRGVHFEMIQVEEAPIIGAAVAGLTV